MFRRLTLVLVLMFLPFTVSCGESLTECEAAFADAAAKSEFEDSVEDLDPAIVDCDTIEEFEAANEKFPDALDGADPGTFLSNRCEFGVFGSNSLCGLLD